jgi:hypothetical protein
VISGAGLETCQKNSQNTSLLADRVDAKLIRNPRSASRT